MSVSKKLNSQSNGNVAYNIKALLLIDDSFTRDSLVFLLGLPIYDSVLNFIFSSVY